MRVVTYLSVFYFEQNRVGLNTRVISFFWCAASLNRRLRQINLLLVFLFSLLTERVHSLFGVRVPHAVHGRNVHQNVRARHTDILRFGVQPFRLRRHHGLYIRGRVVSRQRRLVRSVRAESVEAVADI